MSSQQYGQAAPPPSMMFPTAAYLQASQNAAEMQMRGQEALGKGIAGGISSIGKAYGDYKEDQSKFDATKKMYSAFKSFLPEESQNEIEKMFADTGMSVKEKNQISPLLMNMIAQGQQQTGREKVARIMHPTSQQPRPSSFGGVPTLDNIFSSPVNQSQPQDNGNLSGLPMNPSQGNPEPLIRTVSSGQQMPLTRINPDTGVPQFYDQYNKRYVDELYFDPKNLEIGR